MKSIIISNVTNALSSVLSHQQLKSLLDALNLSFIGYDVVKIETSLEDNSKKLIDSFLAAKKIEGSSEKTIKYYRNTINSVMDEIGKQIVSINTDDIRLYLSNYQEKRKVSNVTIDNVRRILSSFFSWLEDENYILKNPIRRIHKVKTAKIIKEAFSDEDVEKLREETENSRDLAIIDFLKSTGVRVGELVTLNRDDIDFVERECIVLGKGNKERIVYFDATAKLHLENYLGARNDDNPALFVHLRVPNKRLEIGGVESMLRNLGKKASIKKVYPHRFRRTLATTAIDKGMPIEQVQHLLGHQRIDTTLHYAIVKQQNVKQSHRKYIG